MDQSLLFLPHRDAEAGSKSEVKVDASGSPADSAAEPEVHKWNLPVRWWRHLKYALTADVHENVHLDETISRIHTEAEVFDPRTEKVDFAFLCYSYFSLL